MIVAKLSVIFHWAHGGLSVSPWWAFLIFLAIVAMIKAARES